MKTISEEFDFNLLKILIALDKARNVSAAAEVLGMSQSGFSTALARLRKRLGDPVFVRTPRGMAPTPRCQKMLEASHHVASLIYQGVLEQPTFNPNTSSAEFRLAMTDVAEIVFLPRLMSHLQKVAPKVRIAVTNYNSQDLKGALMEGEVDLVAGYFPELKGAGFFKQQFYTHTYACILRRDHPTIHGSLTMKEYLALGHAMVTTPARSIVHLESQMARQGIDRQIVLKTPHFLSLPSIIESTDLVATVPLAACTKFARSGTLQLLRTPFTPPSFPVQQHWHRRQHQDPKHKWLRNLMAQLFDESQDEWAEIEAALYGKTYRPNQNGRAVKS